MRKKIERSVVVITGASSGIGRCTALEFAHHGARVVLAARNEQALEDAARDCRAAGAETLVVVTDVTDENAVQNLANRAMAHFGHIDTWVNDAGVIVYGKAEETPTEAYRQVIETNLLGSIYGSRTAISHFKQRNEGILINVASMVGKVGAPYMSAYAASKFGVVGFSESLRMELVNDPHIFVCTIMPAAIDTPLFQNAANYTGREIKAMKPTYPPEKVAKAIVHCAQHPHREWVVGAAGKQSIAMRRTSKRLTDRVMMKSMDKNQFEDRPSVEHEGNLFDYEESFHAVRGGWRDDYGEEGLSRGAKIGIAAGVLTLAGLVAMRSRSHGDGLHHRRAHTHRETYMM